MSVSVVIAAYNAQETIERAIRTVQEQTCPPDEIIVIDDCSSDKTTTVVRRLAKADSRIKLIKSPKNGGPAAARNIGFRAARGEWIAIQDADDAWANNRLELMLDAARLQDADIVADNMMLYDLGADKITRTGFPVERGLRPIQPIDLFEQDVQLGAEFGYGLLQPILRRRFLEEHALSYSEQIRYGEDMLFLAEILFCGARAVLIPEPLYIYTTRVGEFSGQWSPHSKSVPRFDLIADGFDTLKAKYGRRIAPEVTRAMNRLAHTYRMVHGANQARAQRHDKGLVAYAIHVALRPAVLVQVFRQQARRLLKRLKPVHRPHNSGPQTRGYLDMA